MIMVRIDLLPVFVDTGSRSVVFIFLEKHSTNVTALPRTDTSSFNILAITKDKALYLALARPPDFNMAVLLMKVIPLND